MKKIVAILTFFVCFKTSLAAATTVNQTSIPSVNAMQTLSKITPATTTAMPGSPMNGSPECSDTQSVRHAAANQFGAVINNTMQSTKAPTVNLLGLAESCFSGIFSFDIMPTLAVNLCGMAYNYFMSTSLGQEIQGLENTLSQGITLPYGGGNIGLQMQGGVGVGGGSGPTANSGTTSFAQSAENLGTKIQTGAIQSAHSFSQSLNSQMQSSFSSNGIGGYQRGYTTSGTPGPNSTTGNNFGNILQQMFK